jgi:outer membrane protein, heavy metal efflux system
LFYQYKGEESKAAVNLNQMRLAAEETELGVRSDVVSSFAAWKSEDKVVQRFETGLLDRTQKIRDRSELA